MSDPVGERPDMTDYGVGTAEWQALPWSWAAERLATNRNFWVVTASAGGKPAALPVWGVWDDGEHRFAFSCSPNSRKARNIAANPHVAVGSDSTVECISIEGRAAPVGGDRVDTWVERYLAKYQPLAPELNGDFLRAHALFEVVPERAIAIIEREDEFATRATRWRF
jgi:hypothetical protein